LTIPPCESAIDCLKVDLLIVMKWPGLCAEVHESRSLPLRSQDEVIRRVVYAVAMLVGVVLFSMQFGCSQPRTFAGFSGFPHATWWSTSRQPAALTDGQPGPTVTAELKTSLKWTSPRWTSARSRQANRQNTQPEGSPSQWTLEWVLLAANVAGSPPFSANADPAL
jgi:hypothetical protein